MSIYGINGQVIQTGGGQVTSSEIKTALIGAIADGTVNLGAQIGATLSYNQIGGNWETNAETAYRSLLTAYKEKPNRSIPFFITTDQHGRGIEPNRWLNNRDNDGMNMMNINLGDTVIDVFNMTELNRILDRSRQIKNHIAVVGNHEVKYSSEKMSDYELCRTFISTDSGRKMNPSHSNCFSVIDESHNVKYVVVEEYLINQTGTAFIHGLTAETADWLINELMDDEYDIILLKHWFLKLENQGQYSKRDGSKIADTTAGYLPELTTLFQNRKAKQAGSFTDSNGQAHIYDFSKCKTDLLCALHGHEHLECYGYAQKLLCYCADWLGDNMTCTFGLIDRDLKKLRVWVFGKSGVLEEFSMSLTT